MLTFASCNSDPGISDNVMDVERKIEIINREIKFQHENLEKSKKSLINCERECERLKESEDDFDYSGLIKNYENRIKMEKEVKSGIEMELQSLTVELKSARNELERYESLQGKMFR